MDTLLVDGDHFLDSRRLPVTLDGDDELIQRALIRLSVRRGSFSADPTLGSELYKLRGARTEVLSRLALSYVQEALSPLAGITVRSVEAKCTDRDSLSVAVQIAHRERIYPLEVEIQ